MRDRTERDGAVKSTLSRGVRRVLGTAGLSSAANVRALREQAARWESRSEELKAALERSRGELERARSEIAVLRERIAKLEQRGETGRARLEERFRERLARAEEKLSRSAEKRTRRDEERGRHVEAIRGRTAAAEHAAQLAREQLMAIEVKLDIVQGAITVLDRRTRAALAASEGSRH